MALGKNCSDNLHSIKQSWENLILKKMFEISEKLILEQSDKILECLKSAGKVLHGDSYLWSMMKKSSVSRMQRFYVFSDSVLCLGKIIRAQHQILFGNDSWIGSKIQRNTELWTLLTENRIRVGCFPRILNIGACP